MTALSHPTQPAPIRLRRPRLQQTLHYPRRPHPRARRQARDARLRRLRGDGALLLGMVRKDEAPLAGGEEGGGVLTDDVDHGGHLEVWGGVGEVGLGLGGLGCGVCDG